MRHVFAQDKLLRQDWNYGVVARFGHWATVDELKKSYGEIPDKTFDKQFIDGETKVYIPDLEKYVDRDKLTPDQKKYIDEDETYFLKQENEIKKQLDEIYGIVETIQQQITDQVITREMKDYNKEGIDITWAEMSNYLLKEALFAQLDEKKASEAYAKHRDDSVEDYNPNDEKQRRELDNESTRQAGMEDEDDLNI